MEKFIDIKAIRAVIEERKRLAGEGDLNVLSHLGALEEYLDTVSLEDCVVFCPHIDYGLDGETGEDGTAAILEMYENTMPFTVRWLSENVKLSDPRFEDENVRLWIEDEAAGAEDTSKLQDKINAYIDKVAEAEKWAKNIERLKALKDKLNAEVEIAEE